VLPAKVADRIAPGVVSIRERAWFTPGERGDDGKVEPAPKHEVAAIAIILNLQRACEASTISARSGVSRWNSPVERAEGEVYPPRRQAAR
jgi:hypothetical protein